MSLDVRTTSLENHAGSNGHAAGAFDARAMPGSSARRRRRNSSRSPASNSGRATRAIRVGLAVVLVVALKLLFLGYAIDTDEPQHLHVVWGWSVDLLPYRDFFDNHAPLFHALFVPLFRLIGERPDVVT